MKIFIADTNKVETLSLIDAQYGCNYVQDFIGNHGGLDATEKEIGFHFNSESDMWETNQAEFDWWDAEIEEYQMLEYRIAELVNIHGIEAVWAIINDVPAELSDLVDVVNEALYEAFGG